MVRKPYYLIASVALHALLAGYLHYYGTYETVTRRDEAQVAASVQATAQARTARRVEDLQKIKELLEKSAGSDAPSEADPAPQPVERDPDKQLAQARALAKEIANISRDLKAEEQARLTGTPKEAARAEIDAKAAATEKPAKPESAGEEIARLEAEARALLAERGKDLQRQQDGVTISPDAGLAQQGDGVQAQPGSGKGAPATGQPDQAGHAGSMAGEAAYASAQIEDFMRQGLSAMVAGQTSKAYGNPSGNLFNNGSGHIPNPGNGRPIKARGRMLGAGGQYARRIYINTWYMIGPFQGRHGRGLFDNTRHPPEDAVLLDAVYRGKDNRLVRWEYMNESRYPLYPRERAEDAIYYGYTEVMMDQERDLLVWIGADDDVNVYLNDKIMWKGGNRDKQWFFHAAHAAGHLLDRDFNRTEGTKLVRFKKGRNRIFFKLSNGPLETYFSMVLTEPGAR